MPARVELFCCILTGHVFCLVVQAYVNVALHKEAWQKKTLFYNFTSANLAVDGRKSNLGYLGGQCAVSFSNPIAEWRVDLGEILSIHHIVIQYGTNNILWDEKNFLTKFFLGFSVYLSNTTDKEDGVLCFQDTSYTRATIPNLVNIACPYHGRYVIYYNNRTHPPFPYGYSDSSLVYICEVEVYGCPTPRHNGEDCSRPCSQNCQEGRCDIVEGTCLGCSIGYKGPTCLEEYDKNTYGLGCNQTCGRCYQGEQCNHVNGSCVNGCDAGVLGERCDTGCSDGLYGYNCQNFCSPNCKVSAVCDKVTGNCKDGCQAGWKRPKCDTKCDGATYGPGCKKSCGKCLEKEQCHHVNGSCLNGCDRGYQGTNCIESCGRGFHNYNCNSTCSFQCSSDNGTCHHITGTCLLEPKDQKEENPYLVAVLVTAFVSLVFILVFVRIWTKRKKNYQGQTSSQANGTEAETHVSGSNFPEETDTPTYVNINECHGMESSSRSVRDGILIEENTDIPECRNAVETLRTSNTCDVIDSDNDDDTVLDLKYNRHVPEESPSKFSIGELPNVIAEIKENKDERLKTEYTSFPTGEQHSCDVGRQQENISKNRYKTILPYDHSRVILHGDVETSDYINASYINCNKEEKAYIATQGPKNNTVCYFWRMVWQENVTQIVMLTNLKEGGKNKCTRYWPDCMSSEFYGHITIENVAETYCAFYITRKFNLWHKQKSRNVMQYHFTTWPDHGTPDPLELLVFHGHVLRTKCKNDRTPVVVHCSAGVGRTGTYIALDALYKEGKMTGKINVMEYVKAMRSCRMNMVQTYEQYATIFIALNEEFKASVEVQSLTNFVENVDSFIKFPQKQTVVRGEFEKLLQIRPEYTSDDYQEAGHYLLNTKDTVLPIDKYFLYLTSPVKHRGSYINAIHVSSYLQDNAFIVTQYPTPEDSVDFLRLLIDHELDTVICMDRLSEVKSSTNWMPESSSDKTVTPFTVQHVSKMDTNVRVTNLRILGKEDLSHTVMIVEPRGILNLEETSHHTSSLLSLVSYALSISTEGPITLVSRDGASLCGVFCAVFNSVQQINMDNSVDVFTAVRQLHTRRPEFCSTLDEYWLVNRALRDYIGTTSENVYCNV